MKKTVILFLFLFASSFTMAIGATAEGDTIFWGGIKKSIEQRVVVDSAQYGVFYRFSHKALHEGDTVSMTDTMLLVLGSYGSLFLDPYYRERVQKWQKSSLALARKANGAGDLPLEEMLELSKASDNYLDGNHGDPVQIYKDIKTHSVTSVLVYKGDVECTQDISSYSSWILSEDTAMVFNYPCLTATGLFGGRNYKAWFTTEIPISDGPWKWSGLPGLILKVEDENNCFCFEAIGLEWYQHAYILKDNVDYESCSLEQFNKMAEKSRSENFGCFMHDGLIYWLTVKPYKYLLME